MANKKKPFYSKKTLLLFRIFSLIAIIILSVSFFINCFLKNSFSHLTVLESIYNFDAILGIILLSIVVISPQKIGICSLISFSNCSCSAVSSIMIIFDVSV